LQIAYPADGPEQRSLRFSGMFSGSATVLGPRQSLATDGNSAGCADLTVREVRLEEVVAQAEVARLASLLLRMVSEPMLDIDSLAQLLTTFGRRGSPAQLQLQRFVR